MRAVLMPRIGKFATTSETETSVTVVCGNERCSRYGHAINKIAVQGTGAAEMIGVLLEAWGQGSETLEDYCKWCEELGVAYDPSDSIE